MNKVILIGRFTRDHQIHETDTTTVLKNPLAVDRRFKRDGEDSADFINIVAFGKTAEFINTYFHKGSKIAIVGRIQTGSYTNKEGVKVYTTEVVVDEAEFVESKHNNESSQQSNPLVNKDGFMNIPDGIDEELPFK